MCTEAGGDGNQQRKDNGGASLENAEPSEYKSNRTEATTG
jgi:hypothetical protein